MAQIGGELFDKIINVELISNNNVMGVSALADTITTPEFGRKQMIQVSGQFSGATQVVGIVLRITNLYLGKDFSIDTFSFVRIKAGYKNNLQTAFTGKIFNSYVETPPPDSVTVFELYPGNIEDLYTKWFNKSYPKDTSFLMILQDIATLLNLTLISNFDDFKIPTPISFGMSARQAFIKLKEKNKFIRIRPESDNLYVFDINKKQDIVHTIDFITSAKKEGQSFTINAPWLPILRPGDCVRLNPQYFKQDLPMANITGKDYNIVTINFDFATCGNTNEMILKCIPA
jgi:hypothetical protein